MAYVIWRVLTNKYSRIRSEIYRNPSILVNPTKLSSKKCIEGASPVEKDIKTNNQSQLNLIIEEQQSTAATTSTVCSLATAETDELDKPKATTTVQSEPIETENLANKNIPNQHETKSRKSRVRTYLKRCKDRLTTTYNRNCHNEDDVESYYENPIKFDQPSTLWFDDDDDECFDNSVPEVIVGNKKKPILKYATISIEPPLKIEEYHKAVESLDGIVDLLDKYLAKLYPLYYQYTRGILIRQARDLLVCTYFGCIELFEEKFLKYFAEIANRLKQKHAAGAPITWRKGWPLATETGEVILHLGTIDESFLRPQDIYICIKPIDNSQPELCAIWRTHQQKSQERIIDYKKDILSPLLLDMLTDELPLLLQNLLVGVERAISRIPLNELSFPKKPEEHLDNATIIDRSIETTNGKCNKMLTDAENNVTQQQQTKQQNKEFEKIINFQKCPLKRSELITKNKMNHNKYILRRFSSKYNDSGGGGGVGGVGNNNNNKDVEIKIDTTNAPPPQSSVNGDSITSPAGSVTTTTTQFPLFCLGNSFPHIDSDEENSSDEKKTLTTDHQFVVKEEIVPPRSILELPEKLLTSGIYLPGTRDMNGKPIVIVDANCMTKAGINCYEVATVLLYYSTISESSSAYTILLQLEAITNLPVIEIICNSLKLCVGNMRCDEIFAICLDKNLLNCRPNCDNKNSNNNNKVTFITIDQLSQHVTALNVPTKCGGQHQHDQNKWCEFFHTYDPFQSQCLLTGQRLVNAMNDIRNSDLQGLPTRRQLYAQHRALSRALMDNELHNLRKKGPDTLKRLQELAKNINNCNSSNNKKTNHKYTKSSTSSSTTTTSTSATSASFLRCEEGIKKLNNIFNSSYTAMTATTTKPNNTATSSDASKSTAATIVNVIDKPCNEDIINRLNKVMILFNEVDRAAKRLEQLTEQRRERLRELTRQRTLEDEINEVTTWIKSDGEETLQKYMQIQIDCEDVIKDHEQDFEKYYFISMKHLAKGSDLYDAAIEMDAFKENANTLKGCMDEFSVRLENVRERIEGASRLHHLLNLQIREDDIQLEIQRLADKIGVPGIIEKYRNRRLNNHFQHHHFHHVQQVLQQQQQPQHLEKSQNKFNFHPFPLNITSSTPDRLKSPSTAAAATTPIDETISSCHCWRSEGSKLNKTAVTVENDHHNVIVNSSNHESGKQNNISNNNNDDDSGEITANTTTNDEDEEDHSKIADSGLGGCEQCEENMKLSRVCSCQSFDDTPNLCDKSHNSDELEEDCFERNGKQFLDAHSPIEANSHLNCHTSNLDLPQMEELCRLDPKIQKQLLLIIREMIVTERDYVRSLYYVIENYVDELLRDDIPQAMRGQRNVIFGNIEKIFEFHQPHFLTELEQYETNPLKVGAAFLENESKFYLYALYNKNKPKSDTLMSEYASAFFKSKQMELNDKMDLASYLLKPVQRMGKYALLLQQLVKVCNNVNGPAFQEIAADVEELQRAEEMVKFQLRHGNDLLAMDSLRDCDVNVKEQGRLLRQNEFLVWQGRGGKKCLRQIFLFEELVLFSKARRFPDHKNLDIYIYKNSIKTSDIGLTAHVSDSPTKLEIWFRKRKPDDTWTLQSMSEDIKNAWTDEISRLLWKQAKRNREIRLAEMSSMGIGNKPCLDIRPSHNQINDRSITISQLGKGPKFRHTFPGVLDAGVKTKNRRPNSLISESSLSSGTSSSSLSTGSGNGSNNCKNASGLELINETAPLNITGKKYLRSTTLVSQLSMESGIMSDISMTPDTENHHEPNWTSLSRKSSSTNSSKSTKSEESTSTNDTSSSSNSNDNNNSNTGDSNSNNCKNSIKRNCKNKRTQQHKLSTTINSELNLVAEQDPYVGDSVTVHL